MSVSAAILPARQLLLRSLTTNTNSAQELNSLSQQGFLTRDNARLLSQFATIQEKIRETREQLSEAEAVLSDDERYFPKVQQLDIPNDTEATRYVRARINALTAITRFTKSEFELKLSRLQEASDVLTLEANRIADRSVLSQEEEYTDIATAQWKYTNRKNILRKLGKPKVHSTLRNLVRNAIDDAWKDEDEDQIVPKVQSMMNQVTTRLLNSERSDLTLPEVLKKEEYQLYISAERSEDDKSTDITIGPPRSDLFSDIEVETHNIPDPTLTNHRIAKKLRNKGYDTTRWLSAAKIKDTVADDGSEELLEISEP